MRGRHSFGHGFDLQVILTLYPFSTDFLLASYWPQLKMGPASLWTCIWKWPFHYDVIYILKTGETDWMMISTGNSFQDGQNIDILAQNKWSEINLHKELTNNEALLWPPKQLSLLSQTARWDWDQLSNFLSKYCKLASKCSFIHDYALPLLFSPL